VSLPPYESLNMGLTSGDLEAHVLKNREIFGAVLGHYPEESILLEHASEVYVMKERGEKEVPYADAVVTKLKRAALSIFFADCVPVFILDTVTPSIGLAHGGWRGTLKDVAGNTIRKMKKEFNTKPQNCLVGIGPSIGPCCFEVDDEVAAGFLDTFSKWKDLAKKTSNNKCSIDLWKLNQRLLESEGVPESNITVSAQCTACNPDVYYSYRRDKTRSGRMAATIALL
jgi:YfiH family protein